MRYLLDTSIISDLIRDPGGRVHTQVIRLGEQAVCTSIIVAAELRFGAARKGSLRLAQLVDTALSLIPVLSMEPPADEHYARLRGDLERRGTPIGANDLLIAAHALALGCVMVTGNMREFERVPGLEVENWLQ